MVSGGIRAGHFGHPSSDGGALVVSAVHTKRERRDREGERRGRRGEGERGFVPIYPIHLHILSYTFIYLHIPSYTFIYLYACLCVVCLTRESGFGGRWGLD